MRERFSCSRCDGVDVAGRGLDVDARLRRDVGDLLERVRAAASCSSCARICSCVSRSCSLEAPQLFERRVLARDELLLLLGVERLLLPRRRRGLSRSARSSALARSRWLLPLAQVLLRRARALLGDDARVVGDAQLVFERCSSAAMPLARVSSLPRSDSRSESCRLIEKTPGVAPSVLPPTTSGPRTTSPSSVTNVALRAVLGALDRLAQIADDVRLGDGLRGRHRRRRLRRRPSTPRRRAASLRRGVVVELDERAASRAALAQAAIASMRGLAVVDDDGLRHFAQQRVERRFESFRRAHRLRGRRPRSGSAPGSRGGRLRPATRAT